MIELECAEKAESAVSSLMKGEDKIMQRLEGLRSGGSYVLRRRLVRV